MSVSADIHIPFELFEVYHLTGEPKLTILSPLVTHAAHISSRIDDLWQQAQERRQNTYFDGRIVGLVEIDGNELFCQVRPYRDFLAQQHDTRLQETLNLRPLAVAGLLECVDGIVFGKRSSAVTESAGKWELVPSGGVDGRFLKETTEDILKLQLLTELSEEVGLTSADIDHITFLAVLRNLQSSVVDVGFYLYSPRSAAEIKSQYSRLAKKEYDELKIVHLSDLRGFLKASREIDEVSLVLLQQRLNLTQQSHRSIAFDLHWQSGVKKKEVSLHKRTVAIVQARSGSTRLPEKVLMPLGSCTVLEQCLLRCKAIEGVDAVVCATTTDREDDRIAAVAEAVGVLVFRGSVTDVLSRYLGAAQLAEADVILRVTSDCPLIDPEICANVLRLRAEHNADYASNNMPPSFPHGLDCEAFTWDSLKLASQEATDSYDREHVTPWIRRTPLLRRKNFIGPGWPANAHRWTLDYPEDYIFFKRVFDIGTPSDLASMQAVLSLLARYPGLSEINATHAIAPKIASGQSIVFRFDADPKIGSGHAMRCAALSNRFEEMGWPCYWAVTAKTTAFLGSRLPTGRVVIVSNEDSQAQLNEIAANVDNIFAIVLDHYGLPSGFDSAGRGIARHVVWIDDFADRVLDADVVVNPTSGIETSAYQSRLRRKAKLLTGGKVAPLRRQFSAARAKALGDRQARPTAINRLLISFGGVDPLDGTSLAVEVASLLLPTCGIDVALGGNAPHLEQVAGLIDGFGVCANRLRLIRDVADMATLMAEADLCIGAPGTTTWERCCLGLPSLLIGIAENQRPNADAMAQSGAAVICGFLTTDLRSDVRQNLQTALRHLVSEPSQLQQMSQAASALSDGRGVDRILLGCLPSTALQDGASLSVRLAETSDESQLLAWQLAAKTQRFAFNPQIPTAVEHHDWFQKKLLSASDWLLIAEVADEPVGYLRLDWCGNDRGAPIYLISIAIAPGHYRRGIAGAMLRLGRRLAPGATMIAQISPANTASINLFRGLGYAPRPDGYYWSVAAS